MKQSLSTNLPYLLAGNKIKIVAVWLFIIGVLCVLAAVGFVAGLYGLYALLSTHANFSVAIGWSEILIFITSVLNATLFLFLAYIIFKVRLSLYRLEKPGYQAAFLFLLLSSLGFIVSLPFTLNLVTKEPWHLPALVISLIIYLLCLHLLKSERKSFSQDNERNSGLSKKVVVGLLLFFINIPLVYIVNATAQWEQEKRIEKIYQEYEVKNPKVSVWEKYTNDEFGFTLDVPQHTQPKTYDYLATNNRKDIVFNNKTSPTTTEREDFWDAYLIISVTPKPNKSAAEILQKRAADKNEQETILIDGVVGYANDFYGTIWLEHGNQYFTFERQRQNDIRKESGYSEIANRMMQSFTFAR